MLTHVDLYLDITDLIMLQTEVSGISLVKLDVFIICATRSSVTAVAFISGTVRTNVHFCYTLFSYKSYRFDVHVHAYTVCMHGLFCTPVYTRF
jgi:hypothetical protein